MNDSETVDRSAVDHVISIGGEDLLEHLIRLFLTMTPERLKAAREAFSKDDLECVYRELHALRSGAGNLGAAKVSRTCSAIEMQAKAGEAAGIDEMLDVLEMQFEQAKATFEGILAETR